jgi:hypothetical protein
MQIATTRTTCKPLSYKTFCDMNRNDRMTEKTPQVVDLQGLRIRCQGTRYIRKSIVLL